MVINQILRKLKKIHKTNLFSKNAFVGENTTIGELANCVNEGGEISIGNNCDIHAIISVKEAASVQIGSYTTIRGGSVIGAKDSIEIGDYVIISNNVTIYDNNNHPISPTLRIEMCKSGFYSKLWSWKYAKSSPIRIEDNVWIGERSVILKGTTIGEGSVIGCNSVVTKDIPPYSIAVGNPAVVVKKIVEK